MEVDSETQFAIKGNAQVTYLGYPSKSVSGDGIVEDHGFEFTVERDCATLFYADRQEVTHAPFVKVV